MTPETEQALIELYNKFPRLTHKQIAAHVDLPSSTVQRHLSKLRKDGKIFKRQDVGTSMEVTEHQLSRLQQIAKLRQQNKTWDYIAKQQGVSKQSIHRFVSTHVPDLLVKVKPSREFPYTKFIKLYTTEPRIRLQDISNILGLSRNDTIHMLNLLHTNGKLVPRSQAKTKLPITQTQAKLLQHVAMLRKAGMTWKQIGVETNRTLRSIHAFARRYFTELEIYLQN